MDITLNKFEPYGEIDLPSSKSYTHRAIISAFIANRNTIIKGINYSDDILATIKGLEALGGDFVLDTDKLTFVSRKEIKNKSVIIDACESGSTLRFLIPIALYFCEKVKFVGKPNLFSRPLDVYEKIFKEDNIFYKKGDNYISINGHLKDQDYIIDGQISSQYITGLIYFFVLQQSKNKLIFKNKINSKNYVYMTIDCLQKFGVQQSFNGDEYRFNKSNFTFKEISVEKDYSQLAFWAVYAAKCGKIKFKNKIKNSLQGDRIIMDILTNAGAHIEYFDDEIIISKGNLKPINVDIENCIDLGPILFTLCSLISGESVIRNIERLKYKESDRISSMVEELKKAGVEFFINDDEIHIIGKEINIDEITFNCHNDHRVVMSLSIFALCTTKKATMIGCECVRKSYPTFYDDVVKLRGNDHD